MIHEIPEDFIEVSDRIGEAIAKAALGFIACSLLVSLFYLVRLGVFFVNH